MEDIKPDPKYPLTIPEETQVKYAPLKTSSPDEWIVGIVQTVIRNQPDHTEHGAQCRFTDGKMGFVKEIFTSFALTENQVNELITSYEGKEIERKESFRVDVKTNTVKGFVQDQVVKEVAAFMNTKGGHVIIGQKDNGDIVGIGPDLEYINNTKKPEKDNVDVYKTKMEDYIFKKLADKRLEKFVDITVPKFQVKGKTICIIKIECSPKIPALLPVGDMRIIKTEIDHFNEKYLSGELAYCKEKDLSGELRKIENSLGENETIYDLVEEKDLSGELALIEDKKDPKPRLVKSDKVPRKWKNSTLKPVFMYVRLNQKTVEGNIRDKFF